MFSFARIIGTALAASFIFTAPADATALLKNSALDVTEVSDSAVEEDVADLEEDISENAVEGATDVDTSVVSTVESVEEAFNGVVQVNLVFEDDSGKTRIMKGGTGFLIGSSDGEEYVITCAHIIEADKATRRGAFKYYKVSNKDNAWNNIKTEVKVVEENDVMLDASVVKKSDDLDFVVLKLEQPLYNRTPLTMLVEDSGDKSKPYSTTDPIYALGFPGEITYDKATFYPNSKVSMQSGSIATVSDKNGTDYIQHNAPLSASNSGGPLVNEYGLVIGMNTLITEGDNNYSLDATAIAKIMDGLGIAYSKMTKSDYETWLHRNDPVPEPPTPTPPVPTPPAPTPEPVIPTWLIVVLVVLVVFVVAIIVLLVLLLLKGNGLNEIKEKIARSKKERQEKKEKKKAEEQPVMHPIENVHAVSASMDTGVIGGSNAGETTVLTASEPVNTDAPLVTSGTLIRRDNSDNIIIDKQTFAIGKDSLHVDYCITDNPAVSRVHAYIKTINNKVFIEDAHSTNGTFVNGRRLADGMQEPLNNGDLIKIADEEFDYRV